MDVTQSVMDLCKEIAKRRERVRWILTHHEKISELQVEGFGSMSGGGGVAPVDFDDLPHKDVIKVIRAFGGKWKKSPSMSKANAIDYETEVEGVRIRCWQSGPPPSCKLIEVEEHVPEQVIPAHTRKVVKMSCHPELPAVIATAAAKAVAPVAPQPDEVPF